MSIKFCLSRFGFNFGRDIFCRTTKIIVYVYCSLSPSDFYILFYYFNYKSETNLCVVCIYFLLDFILFLEFFSVSVHLVTLVSDGASQVGI